MKVFLWSAAAISALPSSYVSKAEFEDALGLWSFLIVIPTFAALVTRNVWSLDNLGGRIFNFTREKTLELYALRRKDSVIAMRVRMRRQLRTSLRIISKLDEEQINQLFTDLFAVPEVSAEHTLSTQTEKQLKTLFFPGSQALPSPSFLERCTRCTSSFFRSATNVVGWGVGAVSTWCLYPLGVKAVHSLMDFAGMEDPQAQSIVGSVTATMGVMFVGSLLVYATADSFEKFYNWFISAPLKVRDLFRRCFRLGGEEIQRTRTGSLNYRPYLRTAFIVAANVLALSGGGPLAKMTYDNIDTESWYAPLVITCAFLGLFAKKYWALQSLVSSTFDGASKRMKLKAAVCKIIETLPNISDEYIIELHKTVFANEEVGSEEKQIIGYDAV